MNRNAARSNGTVTTEDNPNFIQVVNNQRVAYAEYGDPEGTPVVFLHGTPGSRLLARLYADDALEQGVRVLSFDRPGYGRSPPWRDRSIGGSEKIVPVLLNDVDAENAGLIAFSGGSRHAARIAATNDDRITGVDFVSGATPPALSDRRPPLQRLLGTMAMSVPPILRLLLRGQVWLADRRDPEFIVRQYTSTTARGEISSGNRELVRDDFIEALASQRTGTIAEFRDNVSEWSIDLTEIDIPIRFWHGTEDTNVPIEDARQSAAAIPTAELREVPDTDHLRTLLQTVPDVLEEHQ